MALSDIIAACHQLVQSVLKIGFMLEKKRGIGGGGRISAWGAMHMAATLAGYRTALLALAGPFFILLAQMGLATTPLPL